MKIENYTPHDVTICFYDGANITLKSKGVARCLTSEQIYRQIDIIPIYKIAYGEVSGLPEPKEDTIYVVSKIVAEALKNKRNDLYIVASTIKDENGQVIGCRGLSKIWIGVWIMKTIYIRQLGKSRWYFCRDNKSVSLYKCADNGCYTLIRLPFFGMKGE